jgi:hypothetical protein
MELGENNDGGEMQDMIHQVDGDGSGEINVDESYRIMKKKHHPSSKPSAEPSSEHSSEHDCRDTIGAKCKCRAIFGAKCRAAFRAMCRAIFEPKLIPLVVLCPLRSGFDTFMNNLNNLNCHTVNLCLLAQTSHPNLL